MYDPYARYYNTDISHAQVIYLARIMHLDSERIAFITGYAISTVKGYIRKYDYLYDKAKEMFGEVKTTVPPTIKGNWCYWIRVYCDGVYAFDKIGKTTRTPKKRIEEMMRTGWRGYEGELTCKIIEIFDCGSRNPVGLENILHGVLISKGYPHIPNDRFKSAIDRDLVIQTAKQFGYYKD